LLPLSGPNRPATFRPQGFAPSRRLPPPPTFLHLSAKVTLVRFSLQGFPLSNRTVSSSLTVPLLALLPRIAHSPPSQERTKGTRTAFLGWSAVPRLYRLQGLAPFESPLRASNPFKFARRPIPSWAFPSLRFPHQCGRRIFTPSARVLPPMSASNSFPLAGSTIRSEHQPHLSVSGHPGSAPLSREMATLPRFPAFRFSPV
jgi:hypothetical protein